MVLQGYTTGVSVVSRGLVITIDGTNNEHTDVIRHFSSEMNDVKERGQILTALLDIAHWSTWRLKAQFSFEDSIHIESRY